MDPENLRIHHVEETSRSNGPGLRSVVWMQGCTLRCPDCFNPALHTRGEGYSVSIKKLSQSILSRSDIEGISISGGEPLEQMQPLINFLRMIKRNSNYSVLLFTGYKWEEVLTFPEFSNLLKCLDVLLTGRYFPKQPTHNFPNPCKKVHLLTHRYCLQDIINTPSTEIIIHPDGSTISSGISPVVM